MNLKTEQILINKWREKTKVTQFCPNIRSIVKCPNNKNLSTSIMLLTQYENALKSYA